MYLIAFPLLLIPFALYNIVAFLLNMPFTDTVFAVPLMEGHSLPVTTGDLLVIIGMLLIYIEVLKAARFVSKGAMDHVLAFILLAAMTAELVLVPPAATSTLLMLTVLGFVDLVIGLSFVGRGKPRAIMIEGADRAGHELHRRQLHPCGHRAGRDRGLGRDPRGARPSRARRGARPGDPLRGARLSCRRAHCLGLGARARQAQRRCRCRASLPV